MKCDTENRIKRAAEERYAHFLSTKQESLKLKDALDGYFEEGSPYRHAYAQYLTRRRGPAADALAQKLQADQLRQLVEDGVLTRDDLEKCAARLMDPHSPAPWIQVRSLIRRLDRQRRQVKSISDTGQLSEETADASGSQSKDTAIRHAKIKEKATAAALVYAKELPASQILQRCRRDIYAAAPYLYAALSALKPEESTSVSTMGTDGETLYYRKDWLVRQWAQDSTMVRRTYLHTLLHCLYGHLWIVEEGKKEASREKADIRHLAMDLQITCLTADTCRRDEGIRTLLGEAEAEAAAPELMDAGRATAWHYAVMEDLLTQQLSAGQREVLAQRIGLDDHSRWSSGVSEKKTSGTRTRGERKLSAGAAWQEIRRMSIEAMSAAACHGAHTGAGASGKGRGVGGFGIGISRGDEKLLPGRIQPAQTDYRTFLRKFATWQETVEMDPENFDYIYYTLGMDHFSGMPLIEPLEYREGHRLEQLVIAIDTSGSVKDDMVRRFLSEAYAILSDKENFFNRMEVWILQCDLVIEDARRITCKQDWDHYLEHLEIIGRGGTDFRPVFRYIDEHRAKGEMEKLKALLYYTDGDGAYPTSAPDYETAFIFVKESPGIEQVPAWASVLRLPEV